MPAFSQLMLLIAMLWVSSSVHPCVANGLMVALVGPGKHAVIPALQMCDQIVMV